MRRSRRARGGFTLIEAALTTVIVGLGILSLLELFATCTTQNAAANRMTTAMLLTSHIQECMAGLPFSDPFNPGHFGPETGETLATFNDVDDFDGSRFNPPIDSMRQPLAAQSQYTQVVSVMPVYTNQLSANTSETTPSIAKTTYTGAVRVRVKILYQRTPSDPATEVYRADWIRLDR